MRNELSKRNGLRSRFQGTFVRRGKRRGWKGRILPTVLLCDVKDAHGKIVTDHLWFNETKEFAALQLVNGDVVEFVARVDMYWKGYRGGRYDDMEVELDYHLTRPTNVRRVTTEDVQTLPLFQERKP